MCIYRCQMLRFQREKIQVLTSDSFLKFATASEKKPKPEEAKRITFPKMRRVGLTEEEILAAIYCASFI